MRTWQNGRQLIGHETLHSQYDFVFNYFSRYVILTQHFIENYFIHTPFPSVNTTLLHDQVSQIKQVCIMIRGFYMIEISSYFALNGDWGFDPAKGLLLPSCPQALLNDRIEGIKLS